MSSPLVLEQPGRWRAIGLLMLLAPVALAVIPMVKSPEIIEAGFDLGIGYGNALATSLTVAVAVGIASLLIGFPLGLLCGLYRFPARGLFLVLFALPLLVPSFLWAIGLAMLRAALGWSPEGVLSGPSAGLMVGTASGFPLVFFSTLLSTSFITRGQMNATRIAGGEVLLLRCAAQASLWTAIAAAALAALAALNDPGPDQILGYRTAAGEILVSFAAFYDFGLASRQCLALTAAGLAVAAPLFAAFAARSPLPLLARDSMPRVARSMAPMPIAIPVVATCVVMITLVPPVIGLALPLLHGFPVGRTFHEVLRTASATLIYAVGAGVASTVVGFAIAIVVARADTLRIGALVASLILLALPSSLLALGAVQWSTDSPAALDWLLRSRATVCWILGERFLPVALLLGLVAASRLPPSWAQAAAVHGVSLTTHVRHVLCPWILRSAALSMALIAMLATAETGVVLMLRPPGADSLPVAIFTVMANAPGSLVSALCVTYLGSAALVLGALRALAARARP